MYMLHIRNDSAHFCNHSFTIKEANYIIAHYNVILTHYFNYS